MVSTKNSFYILRFYTFYHLKGVHYVLYEMFSLFDLKTEEGRQCAEADIQNEHNCCNPFKMHFTKTELHSEVKLT